MLLFAFSTEEPVRYLKENTGAISRVLFASSGAAVLEIQEHLHSLFDDRVRFPPPNIDDEAHAARVVFVVRIVQTMLFWIIRMVHFAQRAKGHQLLLMAFAGAT